VDIKMMLQHNGAYNTRNLLLIYSFSLLLAFALSPIIAVVLALLLVLAKEQRGEYYFVLIVLASLLIGVINSGKVVENDLETYYWWFEDVRSYSLGEYIYYKGKE